MDNQNLSTTPQHSTPTEPVTHEAPAVNHDAAPAQSPPTSASPVVLAEDPEHNYLLAVAFSYLFGSLGVDRFYLGYTKTGIAKLLTLGGLGIWHLVDLILIAFGKKAKGSQLPLEGYTKYHGAIRMVAIVLLVINSIALIGLVLFVILTILAVPAEQRHARDTQQQNDRNSQMTTSPTYTN